ncbi:MAG: FKBP-type peptidyl-prolyl cis-trans isomerase [Candidatus Heimdallarchaeota archaeon]|nr:FKBP-type peptidyl-prolyl cis-trans isomerase [Candidatus Heimdallarchaeota archaeon]
MKIQIIIVISILILITPTSSVAYTDTIGIEENDEVNLHYALTFDGKLDQESDFTTIVSNNNLIEGFYLGILGMRVGQQKDIVVPPELGYSSGDLAGKILYFDVTVNEIVNNIRGDNYVAPVQTESQIFNFYENEVSVPEDSVIQNLISSPLVMAFSITGLVLLIYLKTSGGNVVEKVASKKVPGKMTAQERLQKRREDVDKNLQNK